MRAAWSLSWSGTLVSKPLPRVVERSQPGDPLLPEPLDGIARRDACDGGQLVGGDADSCSDAIRCGDTVGFGGTVRCGDAAVEPRPTAEGGADDLE